MKTKIALFAMAALLFVVGCSGPPSVSTGRAALEQKIQRESNGLIRLVSFQKTDGVEQELMGMKIYQMKYTAMIEFTDNCYWGDGNGMIGWQGGFTADRPLTGTMSLMNVSSHYKAGSKGQQEQVSASLTFQKTENGWSLTQ